MSLKEQITEDMKAAMRAKEAGKLGTIRLITSAIKQKEVDERIELDDAQVQAIIEKMIKQRKDSISQFQAGGRQDLVDIEQAELTGRSRRCRRRFRCCRSARHGQSHGYPQSEARWPCRHDCCVWPGKVCPDQSLIVFSILLPA
jgi:hypothetical protein